MSSTLSKQPSRSISFAFSEIHPVTPEGQLSSEFDKSIKINQLKKDKKIIFNCDKEQLNRVFFNLIKNSIESIKQKSEKEGPFEKKISIEILDNNDHIKFILIDNGLGFDKKTSNIKEILNPYYTTKKNGTGLGLSIVSKIINDHNGEINFISISEGAKIEITFKIDGNRNTHS